MRIKVVMASLLMLVLLLPGIACAQEDSNEQPVYDFISIENMAGRDINTQNAVISPDGLKIVYAGAGEICLHRIDLEASHCQPFEDRALNFVWSPDSRYVAFNQDFFRLFNESDLWVFDSEFPKLYNLTDDGIDEFRPGSQDAITDVLPFWSPDGMLYFIRYAYAPLLDRVGTEILRVSFANGVPLDVEPESVRDLSLLSDAPYSIYNMSYNTMSGSLAISPDGSTLAFMFRPPHLDSPEHGLWLMDIASGKTRQLITREEALSGLPEWLDMQGFILDSVAWRADGASLIMMAQSNYVSTGLTSLWFTVDADEGTVQQYFDFTDIPDMQVLIQGGYAIKVPRAGVYVAEDDVFVGFHWAADAMRLYETHPDDLWQYQLVDGDTIREKGSYRGAEFASYGIDGDTVRVLIYGSLITLQRHG